MPRKSSSKPSAGESSEKWYQLKITLCNSEPPIWRQIVVPDCTLENLHIAIQDAMGWEDCHMHDFEIGKQRFMGCTPMGEFIDSGWGDLDASEYWLSDLIKRARTKILYNYDFGDDWYHDVVVEKIFSSEPELPVVKKKQLVTCIAGEGACPPEDCGGIWDYSNMLEILQDPKHPEHENMKEWHGDIDPLAFDLAATNKRLAKIKRG